MSIKLSPGQRDRMLTLALACAVGSSSSSRQRAPWLDDTTHQGTSAMWVLVRRKLVETQLPAKETGRVRFRPTSRGWAYYDRWIEEN